MAANDCPVPVDTRMSDGVRYFGLSLFVFASVFFPACIAWWYMRRDDALLRKRHFGLMVISTLGIFMQIVTGALRNYTGFDSFSCAALLFLSFFYLPVAVGPVMVRVVLFRNQLRFEQALGLDRDAEGGAFDAQDYIQGSRLGELGELLQYAVCSVLLRRRYAGASATADEGSARHVGPALGDSMPAVSTKTIMTEGGRERNREQRLRYFLKSGTYATSAQLLITLVALGSVLGIGLQPGSPYFNESCTGCELEGAEEVLLFVTGLVIAVAYAVLLWQVRSAPDPLGIKRELQQVLALGGVIAVGMGLAVVDINSMFDNGQFNWLLVICVGGIMVFIVQCPLQVWRSRSAELRKATAATRKRRDTATPRLSLTTVLGTPELRRTFQMYLQTEFSSENVIFIDVVDAFRAQRPESTPKMAAVRAVDIFLTFIRDRSMLEVNISGETRRKLRASILPLQEALANNPNAPLPEALVPSEGLFDAARAEVYALMETDSFPRFLASPEFQRHKGTLAVDAT